MTAHVRGQLLPFLLLSSWYFETMTTDQGTRFLVVPVQAPGVAARPADLTLPDQGRIGASGKPVCPPGTDVNICAALGAPLPSSVPKGGPMVGKGIDLQGLSNQQSLRGMTRGN